MNEERMTPDAIRAMKTQGRKIAGLTACDSPMAQVLDRAGVPLIIVGDSVAIGAAPDCDGQVLVTQDLLGMLPEAPFEACFPETQCGRSHD